MRTVNSVTGYILAAYCSGTIFLVQTIPAGCVQVTLSPTYDAVNYTTTTTTIGTIFSSRTSAATGSTISSPGTVFSTIPATLYQTSGSVAFTAATTGPTYTGTVVNVPAIPYCTGAFGTNNYGSSPGNNAGLSYAIWDQPWSNSPSLSIDMAYMGALADPYAWGRTNRIGITVGVNDPDTKLYDDSPATNLHYVNVMHTGYLYARVAGTYTFSSVNADDIVYLWVGSLAVSGFNNTNANFKYYYTQPGPQYTINLAAGSYTPFRVFWGNINAGGLLSFTITDPNGVQLLNSTGSKDIVVAPCPNAAPATPTFTALQPSCSGGLQYELLNNPIICPNNCAPDPGYGYNTFNAGYFNQNSTLLPQFRGYTGAEPSFFYGTGSGPLYGQPSRSLVNTSLVLRGYFVPPVGGTYTLSMPVGTAADDVAYLWADPNSILTWNGWNESNKKLRSTYFTPSLPGAATNIYTYTFTATAGVYLPITILWANQGGGGGLDISTKFPNGTTVTAMAGLYVSPGCPRQ
ncbi:hypothetical protein ACN47E_004331 [Coniothyrium glycines]